MKPYRVLHFVSGGGSGSTAMTVALASGNQRGDTFEPMIVFRRKKKRNPDLDKQIQANRIQFKEVCESPKFQTINQLRQIIAEFKPHVFVAHGFSEHIWGRIAATMSRVPVIIQVEHNNEKYAWHRLWQSKLLLKHTNKVICVSQGVKKHLSKLGFDPEKIDVIYNGIPVAEFLPHQKVSFQERLDNLIMVARFARQKDHESLIRAIKILQDSYPQLQLLLIGGGKQRYKEQSIALCQELQLTDRVKFLNQQSRPEIQQLLGKNKIFVLSTHHEGLPLALIEAMAAGCAVIASNVDGVSELIDHQKTGLLVNPSNPQALADAIRYLLDHPEQAAEFARGGQENAIQHFNMETMVQQYEQLFLDQINQTNMHPKD